MPAGQHDKRRGGHRCVACRKAHRQCDGRQPCSTCQARGTSCILPRPPTGLHVVNVIPAPTKALTRKGWKNTSIFFQASLILPLSVAFRSPDVVYLNQTDEAVNEAVSIIGQLYEFYMGSGVLEPVQEQRIRRSLSRAKWCCARDMASSAQAYITSKLLAGLLLSVADLFTDPTATNWRLWMAQVCKYADRMIKHGTALSSLDEALIRFCQLNDTLGSLSRCEKLLGSNFSAKISLAKENPEALGVPSSIPFSDRYDHLLSILWQWANWQQSLTEWLLRNEYGQSEVIAGKEKVKGLKLVIAASRLQAEILDDFLDPSSLYDPACHALVPYFRWVLLGITQALQHDTFTLIDCEMPILPISCLQDQAHAVLDDVEELTKCPTLEVIYFLPLMETIGPVLVLEQDRKRALRFIDKVEARGFKIAREYRDEC